MRALYKRECLPSLWALNGAPSICTSTTEREGKEDGEVGAWCPKRGQIEKKIKQKNRKDVAGPLW